MNVELTRDAKKALALIYDMYLNRRKSGMRKQEAAYIDSYSQDFRSKSYEIDDYLPELQNAAFIVRDIIGGILITDKAIIFMENLTVSTIKEWLSFGAQFIP